MKWIVYGSNTCDNKNYIYDVLNNYRMLLGDPDEVITPNCEGINEVVNEWASNKNLKTLVYYIESDQLDKNAYEVKNREIIEYVHGDAVLILLYNMASKEITNIANLAEKENIDIYEMYIAEILGDNKNVNIALEKPFAGWSNLYISDGNETFNGSLSYVDNVPQMFLDAAIKYNKGENVVLSFDEEGTEFKLVLCQFDKVNVIIQRTDKPELKVFDIWCDDFLNQIVHQLSDEIDNWASWDAFGNSEEELQEEIKTNKELLSSLINIAKQNR